MTTGRDEPAPPARGRRSVLFVCLGNICRSPLAQGIFEHLLEERGITGDFTVASCGIGHWHIGSPPDPRTVAVADQHGIRLRSRARQIDAAGDPARYELILGMDSRNVASLIRAGYPADRVGLFLGYLAADDPAAPREVPDPYDGDRDGFVRVHGLVRAGAEALLDEMLRTP
ncbi:MAG: low molecular weight phosphotyrosine protein phosphatase [Phycisphaerales bacterium]|nr:low molecular weight phosphotyrosine protein phosphatase [Phycisphaerales bacterium]